MASTVKKRSASKKASSGDQPFVTGQRKREILGLILLVVSALLLLAIVSYEPLDDRLARRFSLDALLDPGDDRALNALGLTGAWLARLMVPQFLGYCSILLPLLLGSWGWIWFRNRVALYLPLVTWLVLGGAVFLSTLFGWVGLVSEADMTPWAGAVGLGLAGWMDQVFGRPGSFGLIVLLLSVTVLLIIDRDIQRSLDRVENFFIGVGKRFRKGWENYTIDRLERKEVRKEALAERRKQRDNARETAASQAKTGVAAPATPEPRFNSPREAEVMPPPAKAVPPQPPRTPVPLPPAADADVAIQVAQRVQEERADDLPSKGMRSPFRMPPLDLLDSSDASDAEIDHEELEENKRILLDKLSTYSIEIVEIKAIIGPTVTLYELTPAPGVKISRITALENDLAMAMAAPGIRMIAPIPGKTAIGVEIPNRHRELVRIRDVIGTARFRDNEMELPLILGKSIEGEVVLQDLTKLPHGLIAGATGSGKSVGLNTFIAGLLYACSPDDLKFVMIDPKKIELSAYSRIASHYVAMPPEADTPIITDVAQALGTLKSCEREMEERYDLLSAARVRSIREYNERFDGGTLDPSDGHKHLPYIVVVVDELADLMMTAGKDIEAPIARLAQMARAVGIHLILATQRPSVDVITGLIKANFPARMAYQVASKIDSRTILDQNGAEGLVGNGDLLYMLGSKIIRLQGPYVSLEEIDRVTQHIGEQRGPGPYVLPSIEQDGGMGGPGGGSGGTDRDDLFEEAARIIVRSQQGSVSLLQRKLSVGYSRAARIVDQLEDAGIVGPFEGSKARQVRVADEMELDALLRS
ncbi:MAG: DNA translocase FtsK 4TM domain-containing protein [Rhodothermales bacterium]|nr:DNA translocase FtsK 4TM domain-containing protein [Rhodothermales bacterium]MBO6779858.1 DNA translocase FtsK 4TM domain-containing protein [Rhodothermales bacterium]